MKYLFIGGAGFIGTHLAPALQLAGHDVEISDNLSGVIYHRVPNVSKMHKANALDYSSMLSVFNKVKPDVVILGVGFHYKKDEIYNHFKDSELILNSANTVCSLLSPKVKRVVFLSHSDVYGGPETTRPLSEDRKIVTPSSYRGSAYLAAEKLLTHRCIEVGAELSVVRLFDIVGPRVVFNFRNCLANSLIDLFITRKQVGLVGCDKKRDLLHIDDAVSALIALEEKRFSGVVNVGSGKGITGRALIKELGKSIKIFNPPVEALDPPNRPSYSAIADVRTLKEIAPWWEPKVSITDYLPDLVEFRRQEVVYNSPANRVNVLAEKQKGGS
jgi:nucleoside-diphosphate-sugar epimerase